MHVKYPNNPVLFTLLFVLLFLHGCSNNDSIFSRDNIPLVHRIDIQQGNVIDQSMLAQLKLGMEKKKVLFIMGTPLIKDTFHDERWDYIYSYKKGREPREQRRVTLFFNDERLSHIKGDVRNAYGDIEVESRLMEQVEVPEAEPDTIVSKVKKMISSEDEPLIKDKPEVEEIDSLDDDNVNSEAAEVTEMAIGNQDVSEAAPTEEENSSGSEKSGLFDKTWRDGESAPSLDDPILTDPALNPSL